GEAGGVQRGPVEAGVAGGGLDDGADEGGGHDEGGAAGGGQQSGAAQGAFARGRGGGRTGAGWRGRSRDHTGTLERRVGDGAPPIRRRQSFVIGQRPLGAPCAAYGRRMGASRLTPPTPPTSPSFWRSPLRGPRLTALLGVVLLAGITLLFVTGLLSYAAYNPDL